VKTTVAPEPAGLDDFVVTDRDFRQFAALVRRQTGIALNETKRPLVCARLRKRLRHYGYVRLKQYYDHLTERDPTGEELVRMVNALTTNKTDFFREPHHFALFRADVLGRGAGANGARRLRIWSAGCSSGEEAYSIAFTLLDGVPHIGAWDVRILASDIDTDMLAHATRGVYLAERVAGVPPALRGRYFMPGRGASEGLVRVRPEVRRLVTFRRINLRDEPWPIRVAFDAIFCRNVLIYFDRALQQEVVGRLVEHLTLGGHLFLGHSESLLGMTTGLRPVGKTVYQKVAGGQKVRGGPSR
jgi:chemotaxis protein methyltransferase CheR